MLEMYIFETSQLLEQLEQAIMECEKSNIYSEEAVNEIFRLMHSIKGSSAMMLFNEVSTLAHTVEDLFYFLREQKPEIVDCAKLSDLVLESVDFVKVEIEKIKGRDEADGKATLLIDKLKDFLLLLKSQNHCEGPLERPKTNKNQQYYIAVEKKSDILSENKYKATIFFEEDCKMENIRAYTIIHRLAEISEEIFYTPQDICENEDSSADIREKGFQILMKTNQPYEKVYQFLMQTIFLKELILVQLEDNQAFESFYTAQRTSIENSADQMSYTEQKQDKNQSSKEVNSQGNQAMISVHVNKLDKLMDLVGEMVIAESMVTKNPEIQHLELENFQKAARQLHKITAELQDMVMSIRMVPLSTTFLKMHRIMRDMCKKLGKEVQLEVVGEETEVDKNIIEHISDPLMHLIRNAIDHGIEDKEERGQSGKDKIGTIVLEARNQGNDVLVMIKDDGRGLNKSKIIQKAKENGLLEKSETDMTDKEIYSLILLPGFSTKEDITEFSGRGVGMDVVTKNLEKVGGSVAVESIEGVGTMITLKIPLTLAIIDGMNIKVGHSRYTIPIVAIKESFRCQDEDCFKDPDDNEMIMVRGQCYPILRLHKYHQVKTKIKSFSEGILIMVEQNEKVICLFADELLGQQQVVVKALPNYIKNIKKINGIAGCTLLGDGSISLILDVGGLLDSHRL